MLGPPGSTHDATAFKESQAFKESEQLFTNGEWLWADSAYASSTYCVVPYKQPLSDEPSNRHFNFHLSWVCSTLYILLSPDRDFL